MASGAAGDGIFGNVFGGTISTDDMGIQHRPYHRNCTCALHKSGEKLSLSHHHHHGCSAKVSYPVRRSWSEGCLVAMMASQASPGSSPSYSAPPPPPSMISAPRLPPHAPHP